MRFAFKFSSCAIALLAVTACTPEPDPTLLAVATSSPEALGPIPAAAAASCQGDLQHRSTRSVGVPTYNAIATYKVADIMKRGYSYGAAYAQRLRGYKVNHTFSGIFGQSVERGAICLFEATEAGLVYLDQLPVSKEGRVDRDLVESMAGTLYRKMSGKTRMDVIRDELRIG